MQGHPYSFLQVAVRYLNYHRVALNSRGHGIHSPFVYAFVRDLLCDKSRFPIFDAIEEQRDQLKKNHQELLLTDYGAGSGKGKARKRTVGQITRRATKPPRLARLLFRTVRYFKADTIIELGSSVGITTAYLASAAPQAKVYSLEGDPVIAAFATENLAGLGIKNARVITGNFDSSFQPLLDRCEKIDLIYIDGNHRLEPTLRYFSQVVDKAHPGTVIILDDIHWSAEMEAAWRIIQCHPAVTATIDLFFLGYVFFDPAFKEVQHFTIRY